MQQKNIPKTESFCVFYLPYSDETFIFADMASPGMQQTQNLSMQQVLAPQLQQSLVILQAPMLELRNIVQQETPDQPGVGRGSSRSSGG